MKPEKIAPHKDAWTKFLANDDATGKRTIFECDFEDRILQTEPETLPERLSRAEKSDDLDLSLAFPEPSNPVSCFLDLFEVLCDYDVVFVENILATACDAEVLTILTYAPQVQFVTATVKKAKGLPYNHHPFARVMLFEGRRLLEQKQTTITPATACNGCVSTGSARPKAPYSNSSTSSSSVSSASNKSNDAIFSESFLFHVSPRMLDRCHIVIEFQMYDTNPEDLLKGPFPVGHCVVGPMCTGTGCAHWYQMVRKNSLPVCMWHRMTKN
ncbi:unnamed protein product [Anisakis simplex]|uniref:C2 domain-containing protein n=1 Tax=Anisakis simplex TaxID=6269 RepID=A0A3P6TBZ3_ANISI|nr:unnamed protein product [Anisakis simplex]